jgi:hypothetical protein
MRISEITDGLVQQPKLTEVEPANPVVEVPIQPLISNFEIWTTNEERELLDKLKKPKRMSSLSERDQFRIQAMLRKDLVTKSGDKDPTVVANEKT